MHRNPDHTHRPRRMRQNYSGLTELQHVWVLAKRRHLKIYIRIRVLVLAEMRWISSITTGTEGAERCI